MRARARARTYVSRVLSKLEILLSGVRYIRYIDTLYCTKWSFQSEACLKLTPMKGPELSDMVICESHRSTEREIARRLNCPHKTMRRSSALFLLLSCDLSGCHPPPLPHPPRPPSSPRLPEDRQFQGHDPERRLPRHSPYPSGHRT